MSKDETGADVTTNGDAGSHFFDVIIVGAGPVGLSLSLSLRKAGLNVALIERLSRDALTDPQYDGREIALSLRSVEILRRLGAWKRIADDEISPLRSANVTNGRSSTCLHFDADAVGVDKLGFLISNHAIRRALYSEHCEAGEATLVTDAEAVTICAGANGAAVFLADGRTLRATLLVAADTRFSAARRSAGISASIHDFGKSMIVSRVKLGRPHNHVAWECFLPGGALAVLPLNGDMASLVQTFAPEEARRQVALDVNDYVDAASLRLKNRFGALHPASERFVYPLVGVYANRFVAPGFGLIGDAAVGMHPVTAHGFNLGVQGQEILANHIHRAVRRKRGPADPAALAAYERDHRRLSGPLYWSTLALAELYSRESFPARIARRALLDAGRAFPPARHLILNSLTQPLRTVAG